VLHVAETNAAAWGWVDRRHDGARVKRKGSAMTPEQIIRRDRQRRLLKLRSRQAPYERLLEPSTTNLPK
jgi:hypothetical protein